MGRWWSKKYNLPTSSPLYQNATLAELYVEFCADLHVEREEIRATIRMAPKEERPSMHKRLRVLDHVLDGKPMKDEYEDALERGQRPNIKVGR